MMFKRLVYLLACELVCLYGFLRCSPPYKPDFDAGFGQLIYIDSCGPQRLYLMNLAGFQAYQSSQAYSDTLTIQGVTYRHVIRLDNSQATFLAKRKQYDKLAINFLPLVRQDLSGCINGVTHTMQTVQVLSISNTDYN